MVACIDLHVFYVIVSFAWQGLDPMLLPVALLRRELPRRRWTTKMSMVSENISTPSTYQIKQPRKLTWALSLGPCPMGHIEFLVFLVWYEFGLEAFQLMVLPSAVMTVLLRSPRCALRVLRQRRPLQIHFLGVSVLRTGDNGQIGRMDLHWLLSQLCRFLLQHDCIGHSWAFTWDGRTIGHRRPLQKSRAFREMRFWFTPASA